MFKNKKLVYYIYLPIPDDSIDYFETVKRLSEEYWASTDINTGLYKVQVQKNTKWKDGLSDSQLDDLEKNLNIRLSTGLRNFYKTMNGLDKPGINVYGNDGTAYTFSTIYYSYPKDIELIKEITERIFNSKKLTNAKLSTDHIPRIFPVTDYKFIVLDDNNQILSLDGDKINYCAENLSKLIANDIFDNFNMYDFESNPAYAKSIKFWLE